MRCVCVYTYTHRFIYIVSIHTRCISHNSAFQCIVVQWLRVQALAWSLMTVSLNPSFTISQYFDFGNWLILSLCAFVSLPKKLRQDRLVRRLNEVTHIRFLGRSPGHRKWTTYTIYTLTLWPSAGQINREGKAFLFILDIVKFTLPSNQSESLLILQVCTCKSLRKCKEVAPGSLGFGVQQLMGGVCQPCDLKKHSELASSSLS